MAPALQYLIGLYCATGAACFALVIVSVVKDMVKK